MPLPYTKQPWVDGTTDVDSAHMLHIEDGLAAAVEQPPFAPRWASSILRWPRTFIGGVANAASTLVAGHGWTLGAGADPTTDLNYAGDAAPPNGSQCIRIVTAGTGATTIVTSPRAAVPVSVTGKCIVVLLKVDAVNATHLSALSIYLGSGASALLNFVSQQILAFNGTTADYGEMAQPGEWFAVALPASAFQGSGGAIDFTAIQDVRVRVVDDNTGNKVTVYVGGAWFSSYDTRYPNGVVSFSFDDLWVSQYTAAMPKLAQYGYRGSLFAIHDTLGVANYMTAAQLATLKLLGWDVFPHAYSLALHNQADGFATTAPATIENDWLALHQWAVSLGYNDVPVYAWPQGKQSLASQLEARKFWAAARTISNRSTESVPPADPFRIKSQACGNTTVLAPNTTVGSLEWLIDRTYTHGGWLCLCFHKIVAAPASSLEFSTANFATLVDYIAAKGMPVAPMSDVLALS